MRTNNIKALKSGVWYTAANFLTKSMIFLITPIFTRILSSADYGLFGNYSSWLSSFTVLVTLNLGASFISARFDYEDDFDGYVSSVLVLSSLVTALWALVINIFSDFFCEFSGVELRYLNIMVIYLFLFSAVDMFQARERFFFEYKVSVATSLLIAVSTAILSVVLVLNMEDKLFGRILGSALPTILIGIFLYTFLIHRGKKVESKYWKYALPICVPYVPHVLSLTLLSSMDEMMITKMCGPEKNAIYLVAFNCGAVITLLVTSINTAFAPWLGERLNDKKYDEIRRVSKYYILGFVYAACGIMLLIPEVVMIMGGAQYHDAVYIVPPIAFGCVCHFIYTMYVNVEQFSKKTIGMAIASVLAAVLNFGLNYLLIPKYGYIAASYTTLISYMFLLILHVLLVWSIGLKKVYSNKLVALVIGCMCVYTIFVQWVYQFSIVRYSFIGIYVVVSLIFVYKNRDQLIKLVKKTL